MNTAADLAEILNTCVKGNDSIVNIGFNLKVKRAYYGMVHERRPHEGWEQHWIRRAILQHSANIVSENGLKYEHMARHGGAASWLFLPYISCWQVIDRHCQASGPGAEKYWPLSQFTEQYATSEFSLQVGTDGRTSPCDCGFGE